jgi:hypothetical protein
VKKFKCSFNIVSEDDDSIDVDAQIVAVLEALAGRIRRRGSNHDGIHQNVVFNKHPIGTYVLEDQTPCA